MELKVKVKAVAALAMSLLLLSGASHALTGNQEGLRDTKGVYVYQSISPEVECLGLTKEQIKTDVELRLRKSGVRILTDEELKQTLQSSKIEELNKTPRASRLIVTVTALTRQNICFYSVTVEVRETVFRGNGFAADGSIWKVGGIGITETKDIRKILDRVGDQVDEFINDYLAANPKK